MTKINRIIFFAIFFAMFAIFQIAAANIAPKLFIRPIMYKGSSQVSAQDISRIVKDRILMACAPEFTDSESKADYAISVSFEGKPGDYSLYVEANGIVTQKIKESVLKRSPTEAGITLIIQEAVDYLMISLLPVQTYYQDNEIFLTENKYSNVFGDEFIDRDRKAIRQVGNMFITPIMDNIFRKSPFQIQFLGSMTIQLGMQYPAPVTVHFAIPFNYYFYSIQLFSFSLYTQVNYVLLLYKLGFNKFNNMNVFSFDIGAGIVYTLPFLRQMMLHLKIGGGYAISSLPSLQSTGVINFSGDYCFHPSFELEYALNDFVSLSAWCSYLWISYKNDNVYAILTGMSIGFRL
jgi:hypothetical protein